MMYMGVATIPIAMRTPWATFSANGIRVRGGPEIHVWWVNDRAKILEGATTKAREVAAIMLSMNFSLSYKEMKYSIERTLRYLKTEWMPTKLISQNNLGDVLVQKYLKV